MDIQKWIKNRTALDWLIAVVLVACTTMIVFYSYYFWGKPSTDSTDWGSFGDYFAAVFGLLAFLGVLYTARLSDKRAEKANEESIKREERDQFFRLLELMKVQSQQISNENNEELEEFIVKIQNRIVQRLIYHFIDNINYEEWINFTKDYHSSPESKLIGSKHFLDKVTDIIFALNVKYNKSITIDKSHIENVDISLIQLNMNMSDFNSIYKNSAITIEKDTIRRKDLDDLFKFIKSKLTPEILSIAVIETSHYFYSSLKNYISFCKSISLIVESINKFRPDTIDSYYDILSSQFKSNELILLFIYLFSENYHPSKIELFTFKGLFTNLCYRDFIIIDRPKYKNEEDLQLSLILNKYISKNNI